MLSICAFSRKFRKNEEVYQNNKEIDARAEEASRIDPRIVYYFCLVFSLPLKSAMCYQEIWFGRENYYFSPSYINQVIRYCKEFTLHRSWNLKDFRKMPAFWVKFNRQLHLSENWQISHICRANFYPK